MFYCELHADKCTVFENNIIWPAQDRSVHALTHGAYLRVIVPPPDDPTLDTEVAIAIARDFAHEDTEPSFTTLLTDCQGGARRHHEEGDHSTFFQQALHHFQKTCESVASDCTPSQLKVAPEHVLRPHLSVSSEGPALPHQNQRPLSRFFGRDFDTLSNLFRSQALIECEEEGPIAYVDTWFIHHERLPRCDVPRAV